MNKKLLFIALIAMLLATPAFAQTGDAAKAAPGIGNWSLAAIGLGIAAGLCGLGQGKVGAAALEGIARNPGAQAKIFTPMILGLAFIESLTLFVWVMLFLYASK
ncbi:MAG: ATP synthase F0 subunit C [Acidobacteriales bacterium]|nr:ATP synthase F0 subunit C [Terriglobales bacterium]